MCKKYLSNLNIMMTPYAKNKAIDDILESVKKTKLELDTMVQDLISKSVQVIDDNYDFVNCINIHTYGLCVNNGMDGYSGSIGIFYSEDDFRNCSKKITKNLDEKNGKKRMELKAVLVGLSKVIDEIDKINKDIIIHTDSVYVIKYFTQNLINHLEPKHIPNYDYIKKGYDIISTFPQIKFHYVKNMNSMKCPGAHGLGISKKMATNELVEQLENTIFKFGKYKTNTFAEIYSSDIEYFDWCLLNCQTQITEIKIFLDSKN
jgi:ribonuclease HI